MTRSYEIGLRLHAKNDAAPVVKGAADDLVDLGDKASRAKDALKGSSVPLGDLLPAGNRGRQGAESAARGLDAVGLSAKQTSAALRGVPAQFTDIFTSLQGGQAPLQVFLQQGGQLKDMFGGATPAARALGGYVMGLVNPFTLAGAAALSFSVAAYQGAQESTAFRNSLILTGNAAGTTTGQLNTMAGSLDRVAGVTRGAAVEALTQFTASGRVAAGVLEKATQAAIALEKFGGQAIDDTVQQFNELGRDPVAAVVKLNEQTNFLTGSLYQQIKALADQGRSADAARLAQTAYADAVIARTGEIEKHLGWLESGWYGVKHAAGEAWDWMKGLGRADTMEESLDAARRRVATLQKLVAEGGHSKTVEERSWRLEKAKEEVRLLERQVQGQKDAATAERIRNEAVKAGIRWDQEGDKYLSSGAKMERDIARARQEGIVAKKSEAEIEARIAAIRQSYTEKPKKPGKPKQDPVEKASNAILDDELAIQDQIEQARLKRLEREQAAEERASQANAEAVRRYTDATQDSIDLMAFEQSLQGLDEQSRARRIAQFDIEIARRRALAQIKDGDPEAAAKRNEVTAASERLAAAVDANISKQAELNSSWAVGASNALVKYRDEATNVAGQVEQAFASGMGEMESALTGFVKTGKLDFSSLASSVIDDLIQIGIRKAMVWGATQAASFFGFANGGAFDAGGEQRFAKGGAFTNSIVSKPTSFRFASGGAFQNGLMGEAGPEAVMPLTRDSSGRLGVRAEVVSVPAMQTSAETSGRDVTQINTTNHFYFAADGSSKTQSSSNAQGNARELSRQVTQAVRDVIAQEKRPGGLLHGA